MVLICFSHRWHFCCADYINLLSENTNTIKKMRATESFEDVTNFKLFRNESNMYILIYSISEEQIKLGESYWLLSISTLRLKYTKL